MSNVAKKERRELWRTTGKKVIFTDEFKVMIDGERSVYVWRKAGEEWDPPCCALPAGRRLDLMILGYITYDEVGTKKYIEIIDIHRMITRFKMTMGSQGQVFERIYGTRQYSENRMACSKPRIEYHCWRKQKQELCKCKNRK